MKALPRLYAIADAFFGDPVRLVTSLIAGGARLIVLEGSARLTLVKHREQTRTALAAAEPATTALQQILERQITIGDMGRDLAASVDTIAPNIRPLWREIYQ